MSFFFIIELHWKWITLFQRESENWIVSSIKDMCKAETRVELKNEVHVDREDEAYATYNLGNEHAVGDIIGIMGRLLPESTIKIRL